MVVAYDLTVHWFEQRLQRIHAARDDAKSIEYPLHAKSSFPGNDHGVNTSALPMARGMVVR